MVSVIATISVQAGSRDQFLAHFKNLVPTVLQEDGCIEYFPAVDADTGIDIQDRNEDVVMVLEKWESVEALEKHLVAPHMDTFREQIADIVTGLTIKVLRPVN